MVVVTITGVYTRALSSQRQKEKNAITVTAGRRCILYVSIKLTFAGRHSLKPLVINIFVAGTSAVLKPSTARSATTVSAGFCERATPGARHHFHDR